MGYILLFIVVFVTVVLIKGCVEKKKRSGCKNDAEWTDTEIRKSKAVKKIDSIAEKMEEKTAWLEADTKRMKQERARRKAAKQAEKQAKIDFKNRNK